MLEIPAQIKMARLLLGWKQEELVQKVGLHLQTIRRLEQAKNFKGFNLSTLNVIKLTFENAGIIFISDNDKLGVTIDRKAFSQVITDQK